MLDAKHDRALYARHASSVIAILIALAGGAIIVGPVFADPLATGGATLAGTAAIAPSRESTLIFPNSPDADRIPDVLRPPAAPELFQPQASEPQPRAPSAAQLKLGVPLRCDDPAGFFPHIPTCKVAWREITSIISAVIEPYEKSNGNTTSKISTSPNAPSPGGDTHARTARDASASETLSALNLEAQRKRDEKDRERRRAADPAIPSDAVHLTPPPKRAIAEPEPAIVTVEPQPTKAAVAPQQAKAVTVLRPTEAATERGRQELASLGGPALQKSNRGGKNDSGDSEVTWSLSPSANAAAKSPILTARSKQVSPNGAAFAVVDAACNTRDKQFSLRAALVNAAGDALIPLTERMQLGDAAMRSAYFHTELAFNELVLTRGFGGQAVSDAFADMLLAAKRALYEIKTNQGTVLIKVASADGNLRKVLQACQSRN